MKKIISILLCAMMLFALSSCKEGAKTTSNEDTSSNTQSDEIIFDELTVADNEYYTIKVTGVDPDDPDGYAINLYLENKTDNKVFDLNLQGCAINGVNKFFYYKSRIENGQKKKGKIIISDDTVNENKIGRYTDIILELWINYDTVETVHIYPYGEDKAVKYVREPQPTDNKLVDNEYVAITYIGSEKNDKGDITQFLFFENKYDKEIVLPGLTSQVFVNGDYVPEVLLSGSSIESGNCYFYTITLTSKFMEKKDIKELKEIKIFMKICDNSDPVFATSYVLTEETVTFKP